MTGQTLARAGLELLPYALLMHMLCSMWFYGNDDLLKSGEVAFGAVMTLSVDMDDDGAGADAVDASYESIKAALAEYDPVGLGPKVIRANCFPFLV
jgi:hypothetical protein